MDKIKKEILERIKYYGRELLYRLVEMKSIDNTPSIVNIDRRMDDLSDLFGKIANTRMFYKDAKYVLSRYRYIEKYTRSPYWERYKKGGLYIFT